MNSNIHDDTQNVSENPSYVHDFAQNIQTQDNLNHQLNHFNYTQNQQNPHQGDSPISSSRNHFVKQATNPSNQLKSAFELQLSQLQRKLFHQVILKSELITESDFDRQVLKKLSESVKTSLEDTLSDIEKTQERLENPLLSYLQKQQIKQAILQLRMQELALSKVLVHTYRHHEYRLVVSLLHISLIYLELKCHEQAMNHLENAISISETYRNASKGKNLVKLDALYFHSVLLSFLALAQFEVQSINLSIDNLNKALEFHEALRAEKHQFQEFFSLNLISKVLLCADKTSQAMAFARMCMHSAQNEFSSESIEYATSCRTFAQALAIENQFDSALEHLQEAVRILQVHHPSKEEMIIELHQKILEVTLKKLNTLKPEYPGHHYFDDYLQAMREKYSVVENTFGYRDKRAIKEKRHLASSLLKYGKVDEAEEELQDILVFYLSIAQEIEEVVYGEKSVEVAKTLKLLGTVAMSLNETAKAEKHLKKSMGIFHDQGQVNLEKQVQAKLMMLAGKGKFLVNNNNNRVS